MTIKDAPFAGVCILVSILVAGCSNNNTSTTSPTAPSSTTVTEAVSGFLQSGGRSSHAFTISTAGTITASITNLSVPTALVGLGIGAYDPGTGACDLDTSVNTTTGTSAQFAVTSATVVAAADPGRYCVEIYDVGNASGGAFPPLTPTTSYTLSIVHPS